MVPDSKTIYSDWYQLSGVGILCDRWHGHKRLPCSQGFCWSTSQGIGHKVQVCCGSLNLTLHFRLQSMIQFFLWPGHKVWFIVLVGLMSSILLRVFIPRSSHSAWFKRLPFLSSNHYLSPRLHWNKVAALFLRFRLSSSWRLNLMKFNHFWICGSTLGRTLQVL